MGMNFKSAAEIKPGDDVAFELNPGWLHLPGMVAVKVRGLMAGPGDVVRVEGEAGAFVLNADQPVMFK